MLTNSNQAAFNAFARNKRIAVVGGSDDIEWNEVDACDLVVRVNGHWQRQGGRCDVLCYSCADDLNYSMWDDSNLWSELKFALINLAHKLFGGYAGEKTNLVCSLLQKHSVPFETYVGAPAYAWKTFKVLQECPDTWSRDLAERHDFHPLTGVLAVERMLLSPMHSVYVTGMTLYQKPEGDLPVDVGRHQISPQLEFFQSIAHLQRVILSPRLKAIVNGTIQ